jgi:hypothetical protein
VDPRPTDPATRLIDRQRQAAEDLRQELLGDHGAHDGPYFRSFERVSRDYESPVELSDLRSAASQAGIVYVGDFHAVPAYQRFAAELLGHLARQSSPLALGIEFVYTRQQRLLDRRQAGEITDDEFLRRIHYDEEWAYPWSGYRALLDRARELGVEVFALDAPPRGGSSTLKQRDAHAARRIAAILGERPGSRMMVLFGETHLTPDHLPRCVDRRLVRADIEHEQIVVLQNPDGLYWKALSRESSLPAAVRIDERTFATFHTAPLQKYEAFRQVLDGWQTDVPTDEEVDLTPAVHHLIDVLLGWIGIRATRCRLRHRAGWTDELIDVFPEVYSGSETFELLEPVLADHGRTSAEVEEATNLFRRRGVFYDSRSNTLFLRRYLPGPAAGEGARFLRAALTGRLFITGGDFAGDPVVTAYGAAYNEALAFLGARLVDPTTRCFDGDVDDESEHPDHGRWLDAHRDFEATDRRLPPPGLADRMRQSRPLRRTLARDLGRRVGTILFERVQAGAMKQGELRRLFTRHLEPDQLVRMVMRWLRLGQPTTGSSSRA